MEEFFEMMEHRHSILDLESIGKCLDLHVSG